MDQIKIGKFISSLRKENNLTQKELADKLGITDRAISKWENGRGLPDLSLLKPLCDELGITINELLSGERIEKENINTKADENLINTLWFSKKKIKKTKLVFVSLLLFIILTFTILFTCFGIDVFRMRNNLPVLFSTWGYDYAPPININTDLIEQSVKEYIVSRDDSEVKHYDGEKAFVAINTYFVEEIVKETTFNLYAWVVGKSFYVESGKLKESTAYSIPYKFIVEKQDDRYIVVDLQAPRDGGFYSGDMKSIFPYSVRNDMDNFYYDGTSERLDIEINEQAKLYFHIK